MITRSRSGTAPLVALASSLAAAPAAAHLPAGHRAPTYEVAAARAPGAGEPVLRLSILDAAGGRPLAARFSLLVDGSSYVPEALDGDGLRLSSFHERRRQSFTVTYARGTGPVEVALPAGARGGEVLVAKGFEYLPRRQAFRVRRGAAEATVVLRRWSSLEQEGWIAADAHLHYDRLSATHDADWLAALAGDDLDLGHFLLAKGGGFAGFWARQYAFGPQGEGSDGRRFLRAGAELRDRAQGHATLLGIERRIEPLATGRFDPPAHPFHFPPFHDTLLEARDAGGLAGVAHGGAYGWRPTAALDAVLGAVDFFELANTHMAELGLWYQLMNCGWILPPAAGTDLPNFPHREAWQPFLGESRMVLRTGGAAGFAAFRAALARGEVWITSGPLLSFAVDGVGPGGTLRLPARGGSVEVEAELASPRPLVALELVRNGEVVAAQSEASFDGTVHRLTLRARLRLERSSWLAARGRGEVKGDLASHTGIELPAMAHSAAVEVRVGEGAIRSPRDAAALAARLEADAAFYGERGTFESAADREHFLALVARAQGVLAERTAPSPSPRRRSPLPAALLAALLACGAALGAARALRARRIDSSRATYDHR